METFNKDTLVENFTSNEDLMFEISSEHRSVIDYLVKDNEELYTFKDVMNYIINTFFEEELNRETKEQVISNLKECNLYEYIDDLIDVYDEDLINSYFYFDTDIEIDIEEIKEENADLILTILKETQFEGYRGLFEDIRQKFITYLEWLDD